MPVPARSKGERRVETKQSRYLFGSAWDGEGNFVHKTVITAGTHVCAFGSWCESEKDEASGLPRLAF